MLRGSVRLSRDGVLMKLPHDEGGLKWMSLTLWPVDGGVAILSVSGFTALDAQ
jgi:hypothetical protein